MSAILGVVTGMQAEARALGRWADDPRISVALSAGRPDRAGAEADRLAREGVRALLSWGIAGGLDPALATGVLAVPDGVITPGGPPAAFDAALTAACRRAVGAPDSAAGIGGALLVAGSDAVVLTPAAKAALRRRTGAAAVDMESHRIAAITRRARLPAAAVRAVSDAADRRLPALAAHALGPDGRPRMAAVLAGVLRRPWDAPAMAAAGRDSRAALAVLAAAADEIVPAILAALQAQPAR